MPDRQLTTLLVRRARPPLGAGRQLAIRIMMFVLVAMSRVTMKSRSPPPASEKTRSRPQLPPR
jgi:hypothetical protein